MPSQSALAGLAIVALVACGLEAQRIPLAENAVSDPDKDWPTLEELGVPLYPDLEAFIIGENPAMGPGAAQYRFVNFASQKDVATILSWYGEHAEGWEVDTDMDMVLPEGMDAMDALMGKSGFVNVSEATLGGGCWSGVPCESLVQIVYRPAG